MLTVACWECPTYLRRRWRGTVTPHFIVNLIAEWMARVYDGELIWR